MPFQCLENCGQCCGNVPQSKEILIKHHSKKQRAITMEIPWYDDRIIPWTIDGICVFLMANKRCAVYEDRPQVCRDFGLSENFACPFLDSTGNKK